MWIQAAQAEAARANLPSGASILTEDGVISLGERQQASPIEVFVLWGAIATVAHSLVRGVILMIGRERFDEMPDRERSHRAVSCWWWAAFFGVTVLVTNVWAMLTGW